MRICRDGISLTEKQCLDAQRSHGEPCQQVAFGNQPAITYTGQIAIEQVRWDDQSQYPTPCFAAWLENWKPLWNKGWHTHTHAYIKYDPCSPAQAYTVLTYQVYACRQIIPMYIAWRVDLCRPLFSSLSFNANKVCDVFTLLGMDLWSINPILC